MKIDDQENVARVIFSPKMIYNGKLLLLYLRTQALQ